MLSFNSSVCTSCCKEGAGSFVVTPGTFILCHEKLFFFAIPLCQDNFQMVNQICKYSQSKSRLVVLFAYCIHAALKKLIVLTVKY